jgi:hypothetical protein
MSRTLGFPGNRLGAGEASVAPMQQEQPDRYLDSLSELVGALARPRAGAG